MQQRKTTVIAMLTAAGVLLAGAPGEAANCENTSVGFAPLNDLGVGLYLEEFQGGLYLDGSIMVSLDHWREGRARAHAVEPLDTDGVPNLDGKYVLLSIGMSNTSQEYRNFMDRAAVDPRVNHTALMIIQGANGGRTASAWDSPDDPDYDRIRDTKLGPRGLTEAQVQAVWVKVANSTPTISLPAPDADARILLAQQGDIVRALGVRYPNLKVVFFSSRIYAGYATSNLNPEPYAYESGFAVKWVIEAQIRQMAGEPADPAAGDLDCDTVAPWIAWGPYLWADGLNPRSDGLIWECSDFREDDGTHPSDAGKAKVGGMLLDFLLASPFTRCWFQAQLPTSGDCDDDDDCDLLDLAAFASCTTGPGRLVRPECVCADFNEDGTADLADFGAMQNLMTAGPP